MADAGGAERLPDRWDGERAEGESEPGILNVDAGNVASFTR